MIEKCPVAYRDASKKYHRLAVWSAFRQIFEHDRHSPSLSYRKRHSFKPTVLGIHELFIEVLTRRLADRKFDSKKFIKEIQK